MSGLTTENTENTDQAVVIQGLEIALSAVSRLAAELKAERDEWRAAAVEFRSACLVHYSKEDQEQTAKGFIRVLQAADRITDLEGGK